MPRASAAVRPRRHGGAATALLVAAGLFPPQGQALLEAAPVLSAAVEYDDNVYRFADEAEALAQRGTTQLDDLTARLVTGARLLYEQGLQKAQIDGRVTRFRYDTFSELDRAEHELGGRYDWRIGVPWSGHLAYREWRRLESFANRDNIRVGFQEQRRADASGAVALSPRWQLEATLAGDRKRYTAAASRNANLDEARAGLAVETSRPRIGRLGASVTFTRGNFPDRSDSGGSGLDPDYRQYDTRLRLAYSPNSLSSLRAEAGYTLRESGSGARDFSGPAGTLAYDRRWSGRTQFGGEAFRRLQSVEEPDANFVTTTGGGLALRYRVSGTLNAALRSRAWRDEHEGSVAAGGTAREDDVRSVEFGLTHEPRSWLSGTLAARRERRDSSQASRSYEATVCSLTVELRFE